MYYVPSTKVNKVNDEPKGHYILLKAPTDRTPTSKFLYFKSNVLSYFHIFIQ